MLPTEFECIAALARLRFREFVVADADGLLIPELLSAHELVEHFVRETGRGMLQVFADVRAEQAMAGRDPCPSCGGRMEALRRNFWEHGTLLGAILVPDPVAYCRRCHEQARPARSMLGTDQETWSLPVQEAAVDLATDESCQKAVAKLERHHPGVKIGRTTALRMIHCHGPRARTFINGKIAAAAARGRAGEVPTSVAEELEVEYDASLIPVATLVPIVVPPGDEPKRTPIRKLKVRRKKVGWQEAKAGLAQKPRGKDGRKPLPGEVIRLYSVRPTEALDEAFEDLFGLACLMGWTPSTEVRGLADGARYIRPRMEKAFEDGPFKFILDRPHCKEHLSDAGDALELLTGEEAQTWAASALVKLEDGRTSEVVDELRAAWLTSGDDEATRNDVLRVEAGYFDWNKDAVAYADYRDRGWSTASGEIESFHRHGVQARVKISGAWWHPAGVDDILALRTLKANGWWDEYWSLQRQQWRTRAAGFGRPLAAAAA